MATRKSPVLKEVDTITHATDRRTNIPTAEFQAVMKSEDTKPVALSYEKRNPDLDPQLVWRGKYDGDDSLTVQAPPIYIQEKVHPKVLINDLMAQSKKEKENASGQYSLFGDFNGIREGADKTDFYKHDQNWTNRMILGDSLQVMASLAEREGLRGKVQCIYIDPPYGIKFNSNFQWSTTNRDVQDGKLENITREPEQVKAFRDTWRDGIHSYLSYLRDRFILAKDLLSDSGCIFVQIGDENVHKVRSILDEVFGESNFVNEISFKVTSGTSQLSGLKRTNNYILYYCKDILKSKFNRLYLSATFNVDDFETRPLHSAGEGENSPRMFQGKEWTIPNGHWRHTYEGFLRLSKADRIIQAKSVIRSISYASDFSSQELTNIWNDTGPELQKAYVVQTNAKIIERCILMSTDPGDLVLDPTCGSGTTAYVAEQWGRRWITIDTSRVALALARARIMGARYPWYLMADSKEGKYKEAELSQIPPQRRANIQQYQIWLCL